MGIFNKKTDKPGAAKKVAKAPKVKAEKKAETKPLATNLLLARAIRNPRITEKAANISDHNVYTFDVGMGISKQEIKKAIKAAYGFAPVKVNVTAVPTKRVFRRNSVGVKGGGRKAYVYLAKGDKIEFI